MFRPVQSEPTPSPRQSLLEEFLAARVTNRLSSVFLLFSLILVTQSSLKATTLPAGFTEQQVATGLSGTIAIAFSPDGRLFVCEKAGRLRVISNGALLSTPFLTLNVETVGSNGSNGLLGVAFDPQFSVNGFFYVHYTVKATSTVPAHNRISRFTANGDAANPNSEVVLLELHDISVTGHYGGDMHFGADGKLYVAVGQYDSPSSAQLLTDFKGKILRINSDGTIPADNPFYNQTAGGNRAIWALGLRNPFTFAFDAITGRMFINDIGENAYEEIDDGIVGANYGWPQSEGFTSNPNHQAPFYYYARDQGCALTAGTFYNPPVRQFPTAYAGKYFFADWCNGWIKTIDPTAPGSPTEFATGTSFPMDLEVGPDGSLYYIEWHGSNVYRIQYTAMTTGLQYYPLPRPIRLLDTRVGAAACDNPGLPLTANAARTEQARVTCDGITIPANAQAVVGNATVVNNTGAPGGFVTLYPNGTALPTVSNLNYTSGQIVPNAFTVGLGGSDGAFNIYATSGVNFIVDITGYYAPPGTGGLYYHPLPQPIRLLDTRPGQTACDAPGRPLTGGASRTANARLTCGVVSIPATAQAVVGNATVVNDTGASGGFVTLYPNGAALPNASNLNYSPGQIVPNAFTVGLGGDGEFNIYATTGINFIADITGYYSDQPTDTNGTGLLYYPLATPIRLLDTRPGQVACDTPGAPLAGGASRTQAARVTCNGITIPAPAQAVAGNATAINNTGASAGFVTLYPNGSSLPTVSNLNYVEGQVVPNAFTVGLGSGGAFNIYATSGIHFIADVVGYYAL